MPTPTLNLFPVRVPIGRATTPDGRTFDVLMTQEFARALSDLMVRVGGPSGMGSEDLAVMAAMPFQLPQVDPLQVDAPIDYAATLARMAQRMEMLEQQLASAINGGARLAEDVQQVAMIATFRDPYTVDWSRPGAIGSAAPNSGKFTTLQASGQITSTLANGTAPFVVASSTLVPNLNAALLGGKSWASPDTIGNVTPGLGTFTTLNTTSATVTGYSHLGGQLFGGLYYAGILIGRSTAGANMAGAYGYVYDPTTPTASFFHLTPFGAAEGSKFKVDALGNLTAGAGFGCNGKAAQGAKASGGTLAGVIQALVDNGILSS